MTQKVYYYFEKNTIQEIIKNKSKQINVSDHHIINR